MAIKRDVKIIEAILFASSEPVSEDDLRDKIKNKENFNDYLLELKKFYSERGINLKNTGFKCSLELHLIYLMN